MIAIPHFDLAKAKTWELWLGSIFFCLLACLLLVHGLLPYFGTRKKSPSPQKEALIELRKQGVRLPSLAEDLEKPETQKARSGIAPWQTLSSVGGAVALAFWPILPILREIRRRNERHPEPDCQGPASDNHSSQAFREC